MSKARIFSVLLTVAALLVAGVAFAKMERYYGKRGERCSTLCPKAKDMAQADCEDQNKKAKIRRCECDEGGDSPSAEIIYSCVKKDSKE